MILTSGVVYFHNLLDFWVRVWKSFRPHRSHRCSEYCGTGLHNLQTFRVCIGMFYPYPGVLGHGRFELTGFQATGLQVLHNSQMPRVTDLEGFRELKEVLGIVARG